MLKQKIASSFPPPQKTKIQYTAISQAGAQEDTQKECTAIITDLESVSGIKQPHKTFKIEHSAFEVRNSEFYNTHIFFIILQHQINLIILFFKA